MTLRRSLPPCLAAAVLLLTPAAHAQVPAGNRAAFFGGEASGRDYYAFAGTSIPLPGQRLGDGFVTRLWADAFGYRYAAGTHEVYANAQGGEVALGWQGSGDGRWWGAYVGARYTYTHLSPDDPNAKVRGAQFGVTVQLEGETPIATAWRVNGIASYNFGTQGYWTRARLLRTVGNRYLGPEVVYAGNPDYRMRGYGLVYGGFKPFGTVNMDLKAGWKNTNGGASLYGGLEFFTLF